MKTLALLLASALFSLAAPEPIFDGKSLDGWKIQGAGYWTVNEGILVGQSDEEKKNSILWTEEKYTDFVLEREFHNINLASL